MRSGPHHVEGNPMHQHLALSVPWAARRAALVCHGTIRLSSRPGGVKKMAEMGCSAPGMDTVWPLFHNTILEWALALSRPYQKYLAKFPEVPFAHRRDPPPGGGAPLPRSLRSSKKIVKSITFI